MIVNLPTFLMFFVASLVAMMGVGLCFTAAALGIAPGPEERPGEPSPGWRRTADAALRVSSRSAILLVVLAWPMLYITLQSYVYRITGAMCIFGVTQRATTLVQAAEIGWPVAIFALGLYLLLNRVDQESPGAPNRNRNRGVLALAGAVLAITAVQTLRYLLADKAGAIVSCCTTAQNIALGPGFFQYIGFTLPEGQGSLLPYLGSSLGMGVLLALAGWAGRRAPAWTLAPAAAFLAAGALVNAAITLKGMLGAVSPRMLSLPFHHCVYCLLATFFDAPIFIGASFGSTIMALWAAGIAVMAQASRSSPARAWTLALWRLAAMLQCGSLLMVSIHLLSASLR